MNLIDMFDKNHRYSNGIVTFSNFLRVLLTIVGIILTLVLAPIRDNIEVSEKRIERIEQRDLPAIREEQQLIRLEMMEFKTRQESQTEILKKIAEDIEYLRRRNE